ncbi:hypothetical protein [Streptomyces sp. NPDC002785]|uniref:hypothetical protein n=1 Tax=Streptomyces sp. NPDC002785 TaxID=3154543 RepID=UPI0033257A10
MAFAGPVVSGGLAESEQSADDDGAGRPLKTWSDDEWPEWELLDYVAAEAFDMLTGEEEGLEEALEAEGLDIPCNPEPSGEEWDVRTWMKRLVGCRVSARCFRSLDDLFERLRGVLCGLARSPDVEGLSDA